MTALEKAIAAIESQQKKLAKDCPAFYVGEQLKDIIRATPRAAEIVLEDLAMKGMGVADCENKIADYAKAHKTGNHGCCPPQVADRIIRDFYGIPAAPAAATVQPAAPAATVDRPAIKSKVSLFDFMG